MRTMLRVLAVLTVTAASLLSPVTTSTPAQQAQAADLRFFDPGNIISDAVFFDGLAMDAGAVQAFLNDKGASCRVGTDGSPCLKNYSMNTRHWAADNLCAGYQGAANESAALIITKVAVSCGVSPRVLLVLLEKEMGFIRTTNPTAKKYDRAAGYACPDNVGGWCNPEHAGLQNQLYKSAWQYKRYAAVPQNYSYRAGRDNVIQWHPNAGCGTSVVRIQNQATAGLYNYTPYRPNQAALNAGYGTGDNCSSYGNRNFWNFFTDWFGSTQSAGAGAIQTRYSQLGGPSSFLGGPTTGYVCGLRDYGCFQHYAGGSIYWTPATGANYVAGAMREKWAATGWELGAYGYPTGEPGCGLVGNGCFQVFQGGSMYSSPATGTVFVRGHILDLWASTGWELGWLGYPTSDVLCGLKDSGCVSYFQNGSIWWSAATGAKAVNNQLMSKFWALGYESGAAGYPTSNVSCSLPGGGCFATFQGGSIYWSASTGAMFVRGQIRDQWAAQGWEAGWLGYPTSDVLCGLKDSGCVSYFQNGSIWWSAATGAKAVNSQLMSKFWALGYASGPAGYPTSNVTCGQAGGGCSATFQGGSIHWSPSSGAMFVRGQIRDAWRAQGAESGWLGYPTSDVLCGLKDSGCVSYFQNGSIWWSAATGAKAVNSQLMSKYWALGYESGGVGYPTGDVICDLPGGGCGAPFQGGSIYWSPSTGAHYVRGTIRDLWAQSGWEAGWMGYPTTDTLCGLRNGGCFTHFERASIYWSNATGTQYSSGAIAAAWEAQGWEAGAWGYPTTSPFAVNGGLAQRFQGGTATWNAVTGVVSFG